MHNFVAVRREGLQIEQALHEAPANMVHACHLVHMHPLHTDEGKKVKSTGTPGARDGARNMQRQHTLCVPEPRWRTSAATRGVPSGAARLQSQAAAPARRTVQQQTAQKKPHGNMATIAADVPTDPAKDLHRSETPNTIHRSTTSKAHASTAP